MVNIEIHGFGYYEFASGGGLKIKLKPEALDLKIKIDVTMRGLGLAHETIVTICPDLAEACVWKNDGSKEKKPYIRVCSPDADEMFQVIAILQSIDIKMDLEQLPLENFIEAKDMSVDALQPLDL